MWVTHPGVWVLTLLHLRLSYTVQCGLFFISLVVDIFSACLMVFLINSFSVNSCNFSVPMGGGVLKVFLLQHLGHSTSSYKFLPHIKLGIIILFKELV